MHVIVKIASNLALYKKYYIKQLYFGTLQSLYVILEITNNIQTFFKALGSKKAQTW